jgi:hypothetical protein
MKILLELILIILCSLFIVHAVNEIENGSFGFGLFLIIINTSTITMCLTSIIRKLN